MITGSSYYSESYFDVNGSPYPHYIMPIVPTHYRILICPNCKCTYLLPPKISKDLLRLQCESCGGNLEFQS